ncbi:MAG: hypothetical protein KGL39_21735 [Patescibacteria group bacterium]|nr:hypothetical protein [Patescibacteria group bacterium]
MGSKMNPNFQQSKCSDFKVSSCQNRNLSASNYFWIYLAGLGVGYLGLYGLVVFDPILDGNGFNPLNSVNGIATAINDTTWHLDIAANFCTCAIQGKVSISENVNGIFVLSRQADAPAYGYWDVYFEIKGFYKGTVSYHAPVGGGLYGVASFSEYVDNPADFVLYNPPHDSIMIWWIGKHPADLPTANFNPTDYNLVQIPNQLCP